MRNIGTELSGVSSSCLSVQLTLTYNLFLDGNKIYVGNKKDT